MAQDNAERRLPSQEVADSIRELIAAMEQIHDSHKRKGLPLTDSQFSALNRARSLLSRLREPSGTWVPVGWKLVPEQPSEAMKDAGGPYCRSRDIAHHVWTVMLAAAPLPPERGS